MKLELKKVVVNIKDQNMVTDELDTYFVFDDATVFNKMNSAMFHFGNELLVC